MGRSTIIVVSDDFQLRESTREFGRSRGVEVKAYSTDEWSKNPNNQSTHETLATGHNSPQVGAKILPFPTAGAFNDSESKVKTINELESIAIENAIHEYNGNLTEAAKALGIGRATLYRKVKQYSIDPSLARKRKMAA